VFVYFFEKKKKIKRIYQGASRRKVIFFL